MPFAGLSLFLAGWFLVARNDQLLVRYGVFDAGSGAPLWGVGEVGVGVLADDRDGTGPCQAE